MALTNKAYTDLDSVKAALDTDTTTNDDLLSTFISQAQKVIDEYLGFNFQTEGTAASPVTRVFDGNGTYQLLVDPLLSVSSVNVQPYQYATDPDTGAITRSLATATDISGAVFLNPPNRDYGFLLERVNAVFPVGKQNIRVAGVWGKSATIPGDIKRAATRLTIHYMKQMDASYQNTTANEESGALTFTQNIPSDVRAILDKRRPRIFRLR